MLGGLADEAEGVRTAALAAGRTLVDLYTLTALELLLPAILAGTSHANWRIRQSSVELLGDLLYKVAEHLLLCCSFLPTCWRHIPQPHMLGMGVRSVHLPSSRL